MDYRDAKLLLVTEYGFTPSKNRECDLCYVSGSIANYVKVIIHQARAMTSFNEKGEEETVMAFPIFYEEFSEPGYLEIDHKTTLELNVRVDKIFDWLKSKGFESNSEREAWRREQDKIWEQKRREYEARKRA